MNGRRAPRGLLERLRDDAAVGLRSAQNSPRLWEWEIARHAFADWRAPPPRHAVLFTGSSTIRSWRTLEQDMAPLPVINRGFGGAHMAHVLHFAERIVLPYAPAAIVLYAGDNDLGTWTGKNADDVVADFDAFFALVTRELPGTRLYFVSIKPSRLRRAQWPEQQRANRAIAERAEKEALLGFIDVAGPMLGGAPEPAPELFAWDGLHLSREGRALWRDAIREPLMRDLGHLASR